MREHVNNDVVYGTVRMVVDAGHLVLVVEGKCDKALLNNHLSGEVDICEAAGKATLLATARRFEIEGRNSNRAKFLIDQDYDHYALDNQVYPNSVVASTFHDIWVDVLACSPSVLLKAVSSVFNLLEKPDNADEKWGAKEIIEQAFRIAKNIAAVRIANARRSLGLDFKHIGFGGLTPEDCGVEKIFGTLTRSSRFKSLSHEYLREALEEALIFRSQMDEMNYPPIGDHDLLESLSRVLGLKGIHVRGEIIRTNILTAIQCDALKSVSWYRELQGWSAEFSKRIFSCPCPDLLP